MSSRLCIITGGSRGIGKAIASKFLSNGNSVIIIGKSSANLERAKESFGCSRNCFTISFDLGMSDRIGELVKSISSVEKELGIKTTCLINSAGITYDKLLIKSEQEYINTVMNVNLISPILLTKAMLRGMISSKSGSIINVSSIVGLKGAAGQSIYSSTKAGLVGFTKSIAKELASKNITANVICPGFVETDMIAGLDKFKLLQGIPTGKFATAEEVADLVWFVFKSRYINGSCYTMDATYE